MRSTHKVILPTSHGYLPESKAIEDEKESFIDDNAAMDFWVEFLHEKLFVIDRLQHKCVDDIEKPLEESRLQIARNAKKVGWW